MKPCTSCHTYMEDESRYCPNCSYPVMNSIHPTVLSKRPCSGSQRAGLETTMQTQASSLFTRMQPNPYEENPYLQPPPPKKRPNVWWIFGLAVGMLVYGWFYSATIPHIPESAQVTHTLHAAPYGGKWVV